MKEFTHLFGTLAISSPPINQFLIELRHPQYHELYHLEPNMNLKQAKMILLNQQPRNNSEVIRVQNFIKDEIEILKETIVKNLQDGPFVITMDWIQSKVPALEVLTIMYDSESGPDMEMFIADKQSFVMRSAIYPVMWDSHNDLHTTELYDYLNLEEI